LFLAEGQFAERGAESDGTRRGPVSGALGRSFDALPGERKRERLTDRCRMQ